MIGTDENRAVLHVEVIFWSGKRKIPPSLVSGKYCPHFVVTGTTEYLGVCFLDGTECTFDPNYKLLDEMYQDNYYPTFLVDKVKDELQKVIDLLESGENDIEVVQETLDEAVCGINDLQEEFDENDSEIETVARECIAATVAYILEWFGIPIDTEEAIRERDW